MTHYLYLVRHGEQLDAEHGLEDGPLSSRGKRQVTMLAERIGGVPFTGVFHSPLQRAEQTAQVLSARLPALQPEPSNLLFDCIPSGPVPGMPRAYESFFHGVKPAEIEAGRAQMDDAVAEFLAPSRAERHDLLITHNFVVGWFVREVMGAPSWRWLGLNAAHASLTVIRHRPAKPPELIVFNDLGHLPAEWRTGLPEVLPY
ncbi:histidine phosphatase family protein [Gryllotalpicola ginsengisoli]|uniref:histidine phosphatase family protein n=1 Tax=Gryllotalpicola ginsengisoli TaxID=444608 RepID=UPI0003B3D6B2|nr:histidine phosphatase family protein [Gryllotalpicola ginsengisoli]